MTHHMTQYEMLNGYEPVKGRNKIFTGTTINVNYVLKETYTRSRITRTRLYRIISYFEGHLPHQKSLINSMLKSSVISN